MDFFFLFLWFPFGVECLFVDNLGSIATSSSEKHGGGRTGVRRCTINGQDDEVLDHVTMKDKVGFSFLKKLGSPPPRSSKKQIMNKKWKLNYE